MSDRVARSVGRGKTSPDVVALVGYMGSGKSTVGRELSRILRWDFVDLDHEIERRAGRCISEIFAESGESGFRDIESKCLRVATDSSTGRVISCGGGIVVRPENRELLRALPTVFIYEDLDILFERTRNAKRPLRGGDRKEFEERFQARETLYEEVADLTIHVEGRYQSEIAREVAAWLGR